MIEELYEARLTLNTHEALGTTPDARLSSSSPSFDKQRHVMLLALKYKGLQRANPFDLAVGGGNTAHNMLSH